MNFRPNLNSLTTRLIALAMTIAIVGTLARIFILSDFLRKGITEVTSSQLMTTANYVAQGIDRDVVARHELLNRVATKFPLPLLHHPKQLQAWLGERHDINPLFSHGLAVLNLSGVAIADYPVLPDRAGMSYADRDYFQQAKNGEFSIGSPVIGRTAKVPILPMAMPIRDNTGKVRAVLVGISALHSPNFLESLYTTRVGATGGLVLVSPRDKLFIGASDANISLTPTPKEGVHPQHDQAMKGWRGAGIDVRLGIEELAALASVPSSGWFVVARLPTDEVFAPLTRLRRFVMNNTMIVLPIFLLAVVFAMRHFLRPLMHAARQADRMILGETPLEPLPVVRNDEVGHLTTAFNRVLSKLLESRAELERRVEQETRSKNQHRQFIAILTHELRTPLAVIDSAVQSLEHLQQTENDDIQLRHQRIRRSVGRINGLVKQFLANDRIDDTRLSAHQVPLDATDLARLALQSCAEDAERVLLQAADSVPCWGDSALVQLALVNLLDNALKYSPPDSPVEFQVEAMVHRGMPGVAWTVADQGTGIAPENRTAVFNKYVRGSGHAHVAGTGLGLYLVQRIAELHGGSVEILDRAGYGGVLRFWLPNEGETICSA